MDIARDCALQPASPNNQTDSLLRNVAEGPFLFMQNSDAPAVKRPPMPPRRPIFGIRVHPLAGVAVALALIGAVILVICASDATFLPQFNPFSDLQVGPQ